VGSCQPPKFHGRAPPLSADDYPSNAPGVGRAVFCLGQLIPGHASSQSGAAASRYGKLNGNFGSRFFPGWGEKPKEPTLGREQGEGIKEERIRIVCCLSFGRIGMGSSKQIRNSTRCDSRHIYFQAVCCFEGAREELFLSKMNRRSRSSVSLEKGPQRLRALIFGGLSDHRDLGQTSDAGLKANIRCQRGLFFCSPWPWLPCRSKTIFRAS